MKSSRRSLPPRSVTSLRDLEPATSRRTFGTVRKASLGQSNAPAHPDLTILNLLIALLSFFVYGGWIPT
ncbi:hypothetical protein FA95DRAFT_1557491 [Auriscalpium vulgare]|uniref:Uncharacterized protein n=1 Tax=Auriscalpium vulgare TaxID=40419 RepID=A0ACB8RYM1_9AGAM|nr:hypothetical protein FA95DRAFT_1557491 [Auriscalpium vulgare]